MPRSPEWNVVVSFAFFESPPIGFNELQGVGQKLERSSLDSFVCFPTILIAHKDLKPEVAYLLTKAIVENKQILMKAHAGFKYSNPEEAWKLGNYGIPLHPGAGNKNVMPFLIVNG